jgi:hypothetical protein
MKQLNVCVAVKHDCSHSKDLQGQHQQQQQQ